MDTMQIVNQLDGLHKKYRQAMYLFAAPVVLLVIAYIGAPGMGGDGGHSSCGIDVCGTRWNHLCIRQDVKDQQGISDDLQECICCFNIEQDILGCSGELGVRIYETECRADGTVEAWKSF